VVIGYARNLQTYGGYARNLQTYVVMLGTYKHTDQVYECLSAWVAEHKGSVAKYECKTKFLLNQWRAKKWNRLLEGRVPGHDANLGLARTVYTHRIWPYICDFSAWDTVYTLYIYVVLANPTQTLQCKNLYTFLGFRLNYWSPIVGFQVAAWILRILGQCQHRVIFFFL